jgi:hypothetical protein
MIHSPFFQCRIWQESELKENGRSSIGGGWRKITVLRIRVDESHTAQGIF